MRQLTLNQSIVSVAIAAMLPIVILGLLQSISNRQYERALIGKRLVESAVSTASAQREAFALMQSLLTSYASDPDVVRRTVNCDASLRRGLLGQSAVLNLTRANADGSIECSALSFQKPLTNNDQPWWREGIQKRGVTISKPTFGKIARRPVLIAMLPLFLKDGQVDGAVTAAIDASWLQKALDERRLSTRSIISIVDARGDRLFSSGSAEISKFVLDPQGANVANMTANDGTRVLYASAPLFGNQLHVVYAEPEASLMSPLNNQTRMSLLLPIITVLATCLAIWVAMNQFVIRWLRRLSDAAMHIAEGHYVISTAQFAHAPMEIAQLGETISAMAQSIEERDGALRRSSEQNHAMAREVNHRVKNNLQMVISLLDLQSVRLTDVQARNILTQTRLRMGAIALVHRILYDFGEQSDFGKVDMCRLAEELCVQLRNAQMNPVTLECSSTVGMIAVDVALPISLFMVEAVTNAYRHGFTARQSGAIVVTLTGSEESGVLRIADDGEGIHDSAPPSAIGTQLMEAYASQINGRYWVYETPGGGLTVELAYAAREG